MEVHLADLGFHPSATEGFRTLAGQDRHGVHTLTDDPASADVILFTDLHLLPHDVSLKAIRRHPLLRSYPQKCFVYDERDTPWLNLPGLYVSMPASAFDPRSQVAAAYYMLQPSPVDASTVPDLLFSFVGGRSHPLRDGIFRLEHRRAIVEDTSGFVFFDSDAEQVRRTRFAAVLAASKFVLCPRGAGTASIRLFETLAAGRVPVILSDEWVPPPGPDWDAIAIRVPESAIPELPATLEAREGDWPELVAGTRAAFDQFFAPAVAWNTLTDSLESLVSRRQEGAFQRSWRDPQRLRAHVTHLRWCGRAHAKSFVGALDPRGRP